MNKQTRKEEDLEILKSMAVEREELVGGITFEAEKFIELAVSRGLAQEHAETFVVNTFLDLAAKRACDIRRDLLGGTPDPNLWEQATQVAFGRHGPSDEPAKNSKPETAPP